MLMSSITTYFTYKLVLWIATRLGCLRIFKIGLLTRGLLTQNWKPVNNPTWVALERQPVV
jgi:hypothetical protein